MRRVSKLTEHAKKENEKFRKRSKSLVRKAHGLATLTKAEVYVVLRRQGTYIVYRSTDESWPPSEDTLVRTYSAWHIIFTKLSSPKPGPFLNTSGPTISLETQSRKTNGLQRYSKRINNHFQTRDLRLESRSPSRCHRHSQRLLCREHLLLNNTIPTSSAQ